MVDKLIFMDGAKAVSLWDVDDDEGWTIFSGEPPKDEVRDYYKLIPTLYRAVDVSMNGVASMPFELLKGKTQYDFSGDWQNKVGFIPNPKRLLKLVEASCMVAGRAYLFKERSAVGAKKLHYHLPTSIKPKIDKSKSGIDALQGFERITSVESQPRQFKVEDYIYFWPADPYVEIGPAKNFPAQAAANASGVLLNVDVFAANYFKRGAIKAMLLTVQGMYDETERTKLETYWNKFISGIKNIGRAKIFNADAVTPVVVGEGMKELENVSLGDEKREDIAVALGIPMSILFANAANYATSQQDALNLLNNRIIPDCDFIASVLNEQLFDDLGLKMRFMPETLDAMQEDEAQRSQALNQLTNSGVPLLMAMDLLGFELSDEQRSELEKAQEEKKQRAEELTQRLQGKSPNQEEQPPENQPPPNNNQPAREDMKRWERKALNALKKGDAPAVPFVSDYITIADAQRISNGLEDAVTVADVQAVFNHGSLPDSQSIAGLTEALKEAAVAISEKG